MHSVSFPKVTIVRHRADPWMPDYLPSEWPIYAKINNIKMLSSSSNKVESGCSLQCCSKVSYMYSAAQIYQNYAYSYYTRVFWVYAYVNTRTYAHIYARICLFVKHSHKFLYMKHCRLNKRYYSYGNEKGFKAKFAYC